MPIHVDRTLRYVQLFKSFGHYQQSVSKIGQSEDRSEVDAIHPMNQAPGYISTPMLLEGIKDSHARNHFFLHSFIRLNKFRHQLEHIIEKLFRYDHDTLERITENYIPLFDRQNTAEYGLERLTGLMVTPRNDIGTFLALTFASAPVPTVDFARAQIYGMVSN